MHEVLKSELNAVDLIERKKKSNSVIALIVARSDFITNPTILSRQLNRSPTDQRRA